MTAITITKHMNAKAFYDANKDMAEVTYAWFVARLGALHQARGDSEELFRASRYFFIDVKKSIFTEMLKRGGAGKAIDKDVNAIEITGGEVIDRLRDKLRDKRKN